MFKQTPNTEETKPEISFEYLFMLNKDLIHVIERKISGGLTDSMSFYDLPKEALSDLLHYGKPVLCKNRGFESLEPTTANTILQQWMKGE